MNRLKKVFNFDIKQVGPEEDRVLHFVGSDETPDRDNDIIEVAGWKLEEYLKNPVFLWAHDYDEPPIGKAVNVIIDAGAKKLLFDVKFPTAEEYPFADTIYKLYKGGYLSATSVGFRGIKSKTRDEDTVLNMPEWQRGRRYMEQELLELSGVPVPCNPNALQTVRSKGFKAEDIDKVFTEEKKVIPYKKCPIADEGTAWDGPAEIAAAEVGDLKIMCAWYDAENADVKGSYKLPHHTQADKTTVWRAVTAAMGALLGARGGVDIPEGDRQGVYNHLSKHYADFDKEVPEFKAYAEAELKAMFEASTKTADLDGNPSVYDIMDAIRQAINPAGVYQMGGPWVEDLYPTRYPSGSVVIEKLEKHYLYQYEYKDGVATLSTDFVELEEVYTPKGYNRKSGSTLSAKNRELLNSIHDGLDKCRQELKGFLDSTMPMEPPEDPMMTAARTVPASESVVKVELSDEFKQALDEIKSQVLLLSGKMAGEPEKDAPKVEVDLDAIELPEAEKDPADIELNIEPGELKTMIQDTVKTLIRGGK